MLDIRISVVIGNAVNNLEYHHHARRKLEDIIALKVDFYNGVEGYKCQKLVSYLKKSFFFT